MKTKDWCSNRPPLTPPYQRRGIAGSPPQMRRGLRWWEAGADVALERLRWPKAHFGQIVPIGLTCPFGTSQTPHTGVCAVREWHGWKLEADC